jgi:hypothetical protein
MTHGDIAQQTVVENNLLQCLVEGLRTTLNWQVEGEDFSRKLSTLRFTAESFQRHLERLMSLEEFDGYLDEVAATSPQLSRRVDALRNEHGMLREAARHIVHGLEQLSPTDALGFAGICDELERLLDDVEAHSRREVSLVQEACARDGGGEG